MRRFRFEGPDTSSWGWKEKPLNGAIYTMDELGEMYGESDMLIETIIATWEDEEWNESHGKWIEILDE